MYVHYLFSTFCKRQFPFTVLSDCFRSSAAVCEDLSCDGGDKTDLGGNGHETLRHDLINSPPLQFSVLRNPSLNINLVTMYPGEEIAIKHAVTVRPDFTVKIKVHRLELAPEHDIFDGLPRTFHSLQSIYQLCKKIEMYKICPGNPDEAYVDLAPKGNVSLQHATDSSCAAYREGECGAAYSSTIRTVKCSILIRSGERCKPCSIYRGTLRKVSYS